MAVYRAIYMSFWTDAKVDEDLSSEDKYFMLYALTNPHTNMCGCYEVSVKQMSQELSWTRKQVEETLAKFQNEHRMVFYDKATRELFVRNWYKYNWTESPKLDNVIRNEILSIKNRNFKEELVLIFNRRKSVQEGRASEIVLDEDSEHQAGVQVPIDDADNNEENRVTSEEIAEEISGSNAGEVVEFQAPRLIDETRSLPDPPYNEIMNMYNQICVSYPKIIRLGDGRKKHILARWKEGGGNIEEFRRLFQNMQNSAFLKGQNKNGWSASFDWVLLPNNFPKVVEGNYNKNSEEANGGGWNAIRNEAYGGQV